PRPRVLPGRGDPREGRRPLEARDTPAVTSRGASLEVRALEGDLAASEREQIAAVDLDLPAVGAGAPEDPLRDAAVAGHHVAHVVEADVGKRAEDPRERRAHALAAHVPGAAGVRARRALEH